MKLTPDNLRKIDERLRSRRLHKREIRKSDSEECRLARIDHHEEFWLNAILFSFMHGHRKELGPKILRGQPATSTGLAEILARDAQSAGRTFSETLMHVAFNLCQLGRMKEQ